MANILLAWKNRTDAGTLSGGSWSSTLPLTNLQNRQVQRVARSANATNAATQFVIDLGAAKTIGVVALLAHNLTSAAKVRITAASDAGFTSVTYTSGWLNVWPGGVVPANLQEWQEDNFWLATLSAQARAGYQAPMMQVLSTPQTQRYWKIELDDTANSDGYVQIGRLFMAATWTPSVNYAYGAGLNYSDPTPVDTSLSGAEYFDVRSKFRVFQFDLEYILNTEAYAYALELQRLSGTSGEVLVIPDQADTTNLAFRSFVGRLMQMGAIKQTRPTAFNVSFQVKELV